MASRFRVTPATLKAKAAELQGLNERFQREVASLRDENNTLGTKWEGEARTAFNNEFLKDAEKFDLFYQGIAKFIQQLDRDAAEYAKVEDMNTQTATSRNS